MPAVAYMRQSEGNLEESVLSSYHVAFGVQTQVGLATSISLVILLSASLIPCTGLLRINCL